MDAAAKNRPTSTMTPQPPQASRAGVARIALANVRFPRSPADAVELARATVLEASRAGAQVVCFPECFMPGYRTPDRALPPPDADFLSAAWSAVAEVAGASRTTVILGTERLAAGRLLISSLVIQPDGSLAGFQDKVQLDPSEDATYAPGSERAVFRTGPLTFGIVICHEGWRYPETVRWAARQGAQVVFHPQFHEASEGSFRPTAFADPANTFHEKALLCRAAENTCYVASVNYAGPGSPTTSAVIKPDGTVLAYQPYGEEGLLVADLDLAQAAGLLARRYRPILGL
jgi:predicted amidohydrolase